MIQHVEELDDWDRRAPMPGEGRFISDEERETRLAFLVSEEERLRTSLAKMVDATLRVRAAFAAFITSAKPRRR
jgi:hypothetical protein